MKPAQGLFWVREQKLLQTILMATKAGTTDTPANRSTPQRTPWVADAVTTATLQP